MTNDNIFKESEHNILFDQKKIIVSIFVMSSKRFPAQNATCDSLWCRRIVCPENLVDNIWTSFQLMFIIRLYEGCYNEMHYGKRFRGKTILVDDRMFLNKTNLFFNILKAFI